MTFESLQLTPFCVEKSSVRTWIFQCFTQCLHWAFGWNKVKYARITITHGCFIALTLAGSLGRCLNTQPIGLIFKQLPRDPANVNARKTCEVRPLYSVPGKTIFGHLTTNHIQKKT